MKNINELKTGQNVFRFAFFLLLLLAFAVFVTGCFPLGKPEGADKANPNDADNPDPPDRTTMTNNTVGSQP